jgi:hypothetical protein
VLDGETGTGERGEQHLPPSPVAFRCSSACRWSPKAASHHGRLHRRRHDHAGVLADLEQLGHQGRVTGDEAGPVAGQVGALEASAASTPSYAPPQTSGESTETGSTDQPRGR